MAEANILHQTYPGRSKGKQQAPKQYVAVWAPLALFEQSILYRLLGHNILSGLCWGDNTVLYQFRCELRETEFR